MEYSFKSHSDELADSRCAKSGINPKSLSSGRMTTRLTRFRRIMHDAERELDMLAPFFSGKENIYLQCRQAVVRCLDVTKDVVL